eukprot:Gb_34675 [translate_table: standard]
MTWKFIGKDCITLIPYNRLDDFIAREKLNVDAPCHFMVKQHRSNDIEENSIYKANAFLKYVIYWCSYGPDEKRAWRIDLKQRRKSIYKRGYTCHFIVKRLVVKPSVAMIVYNNNNHVDKHDFPCHRVEDESCEGRVVHAPYLSNKLHKVIEQMYHQGLTIDKMFEKFLKEKRSHQYVMCSSSSQDDFLLRRDIMNIFNRCSQETFQLHTKDSMSTNLWVRQECQCIFFYQKPVDEQMTFLIRLQTPWMCKMMVKFSHNSLISMDSTFSTNKYGAIPYILMVFNKQQNGLPISWMISSCDKASNIKIWLSALIEEGVKECEDWKVNAFMTDDALAEMGALRNVVGCCILLCLWHVRQVWMKQVFKKATNEMNGTKMLKKLGAIMYKCKDDDSVHKALDSFHLEFATETIFLKLYLYDNWILDNKLYMWEKAYRDFSHANQETNSTIVSYHGFLKTKHLCHHRRKSNHRMDWLIYTLLKRVELYYWNTQNIKDVGFSTNFKLEEMKETSWSRAYNIPDSDYSLHPTIPSAYWVRSQIMKTRSKRYIVTSSDIIGLLFVVCDCP